MSKFNFIKTPIEDLYVVEPTIFGDNRGYFMETYHYEAFKEAGLDMVFVQDNQSKSKKGVLRGMHYQTRNSQGKLVRVVQGEVFDVAIDLRKDSATFGKWHGVLLTAENKKQFYVPKGFAHGFLVVSEEAEFVYKCTNYYDPTSEAGILWNDATLGIEWPIEPGMELMLSDKDKVQQTFAQYCSK